MKLFLCATLLLLVAVYWGPTLGAFDDRSEVEFRPQRSFQGARGFGKRFSGARGFGKRFQGARGFGKRADEEPMPNGTNNEDPTEDSQVQPEVQMKQMGKERPFIPWLHPSSAMVSDNDLEAQESA